jgi:hypothetical protein
VTQLRPGTLRFTRTAPGGDAVIDPYPLNQQVSGFCLIVVTEPVHQPPQLEFYL